MVKIPLTQNQYAIIDDEDFAEISKYKWFAHFDPSSGRYYVGRQISVGKKKQQTIKMHRVILQAKPNEIADHINRNPLDNRRANIRIVTASENNMNRKLFKNNSSGYRGVTYLSRRQKYQVCIQFNRNRKYIGIFNTPEEAAIAYNAAAKKYHGEFAVLNQIKES